MWWMPCPARQETSEVAGGAEMATSPEVPGHGSAASLGGHGQILPPLPDGKSWKLIWSDDFEGDKLDLSKWNIRTGPRRDGDWTKDAVSLDGEGNLILKTYEKAGKYFSGAIDTKEKFEFNSGYVEARCSMPSQEGHWAAFWLMSPTLKGGRHTPDSGTEIDIFEYHARWGDELQQTLHWDGYGQAQANRVNARNLRYGFHIFGLQWTAWGYVFYVDGKPTWRTDRGASQTPDYVFFSEEIGKWAGEIEKARLPDFFKVDYVRVYQTVSSETAQSPQ